MITLNESRLRRKARKAGMTLTKLRENSRWYQQYGPYMLSVNGVVAHHGLDAEDVARILTAVLLLDELR